MSNVSAWSTAAASNNAASPNGFAEGMAPSGVNDSAREIMGAVRRWYEDVIWTDFGHTPTYVSATTLTVSGDKSALYSGGRRMRLTGSGAMGTMYGAVVSSTYGAPNLTITIIPDPGFTMDNSLNAIAPSIFPDVNCFPAVMDTGIYAPTTGSATNSFSAAINNVPGVYTDGMVVRFKATLSNDGSATATLNLGTGAPSKNLKRHNGGNLEANEIVAGRVYEAVYVASADQFRMMGLSQLKPTTLTHGAQSTSVYTLDIGLAEIHSVEFSATAILNITSTFTLDRALVIIKNNNFPITLTGIDNDSPTLTQSAGRQDYIALVKSFGKIGAVSYVLNKATS